MMVYVLVIIMIFFWLMLTYYSILTIAGVYRRLKKLDDSPLEEYPSVAVLVPCYNEGLVIKQTLEAMSQLKYPGELNIYILDDQSTDNTGQIARAFQMQFSNIHYLYVPEMEIKGKSSVLNYGLQSTTSDYFCVFDGDNQPEPESVLRLVHAAERTKKAGGAVGYVKTINAETNMLTRMIALEFQVFQLLMQSGRYQLFKAGALAGTNMLLRRDVIEEAGGYDPKALAEDAELTVRVASLGYILPVVHHARTWEQEPEQLKALIKQRTRWLTGNLYLLEKSLYTFKFWKGRTFVHSMQHILTYLVFIIFLAFSNVWFILGLIGYPLPTVDTPLLLLWFLSYVVYSAQIASAMVLEDLLSPKNVGIGMIMYFTYAQLFLIMLFKSLIQYISGRIFKKQTKWDKTKRYKKESAQ
ncbi:Glycosyltransferase, catalytic subunit of cellulose synthase and poly-beta-1,6-N-acetylglucosamine synthase [Halolactibacillus halophilus]|uniref:Glycosyltransferase, catalytic subunit of cellulose synthase and poly-beta-1,6-N-acetylglucosamine synthase n=2 Tax=Halolactibacillus halophilus TaxID=306540 RepID=A0A1I5MDR3_9BACI|nr:glycosyltransferase [Halolactibacillus halophilus]GEM02486.1 N-acetylglucosaminyltransferase [Halolactibacillus halophilus]SFP07744.1 Glycosyltransferase, catalytic subunit of cellulose synthase and poly-beta-1,6-N-acetylglucosamine synthase [Halolactibacillus halophilus]